MAVLKDEKSKLSVLTEALIERNASPEVIQRGETYRRQGAVGSIVLRGDTLTADVAGSDIEPYVVSITLGERDAVKATCTCPYEWGGWCKHIVAALLSYLHAPETLEEEPTAEEALAPLERECLQTLILRLVGRHPRLMEEVVLLAEQMAPRTAQSGTPESAAAAMVDTRAVRQLVRASLHGLDRMRRSDAYWHVGGVVDEIREVLRQAECRLEVGDGRGALAILEAITEEYIHGWVDLDDSDGEAGGFFADLGEAWTSAILTTDLDSTERKTWVKKLDTWRDDIADYGVDDGFEVAATAARQGWDDPTLVKVMSGDPVDGNDEEEEEWYFDELTSARLAILERQGRREEALRLAEWAGMYDRAAMNLARLGRADEAVTYAREWLTTASGALAVAMELEQQGDLEHALRVAEHGLDLEGSRYSLAAWLADLAEGQGWTDAGLRAAVAAVKEMPDLARWRRVAALAGDGWPGLRDELLAGLRRRGTFSMSGQIDILLEEGLIADALRLVENGFDYGLTGRVVDAAATVLPEKVIPICRKQAESIMGSGAAAYYDKAAQWLARARSAYRALGRQEEWRSYLSDLMARHKAKYKLMPLLKELASG